MRPEQIADSLSPVHRETLDLLLQGLKQKEISQLRGIPFATVSSRVRVVQKAFGVNSRSELQAKFVVPPHLRPLVGVDGVRVNKIHADVVVATRIEAEEADVKNASFKSAWIEDLRKPAVAAGTGVALVTGLIVAALFLRGTDEAMADSLDSGPLHGGYSALASPERTPAEAEVIILPQTGTACDVAFVQQGQRLEFSGFGNVRVRIGPSFFDLSGDATRTALNSGMMHFEPLDDAGSHYIVITDQPN